MTRERIEAQIASGVVYKSLSSLETFFAVADATLIAIHTQVNSTDTSDFSIYLTLSRDAAVAPVAALRELVTATTTSSNRRYKSALYYVEALTDEERGDDYLASLELSRRVSVLDFVIARYTGVDLTDAIIDSAQASGLDASRVATLPVEEETVVFATAQARGGATVITPALPATLLSTQSSDLTDSGGEGLSAAQFETRAQSGAEDVAIAATFAPAKSSLMVAVSLRARELEAPPTTPVDGPYADILREIGATGDDVIRVSVYTGSQDVDARRVYVDVDEVNRRYVAIVIDDADSITSYAGDLA